MRLLIVSQYFWPESFIINDLVKHLVGNGHQVTVLTGKPNYPGGTIYPGYTQLGLQSELFFETVPVHRVPLSPRGPGGAKKLAFNYLSFAWSGLRYFPRLVRKHDFDGILVFAPSPITSAIPAILLKYIKRAHLAIWVQDLWPQSLKATGFVRSPWLLGMMGWVVRGIYYFADTILIQSRAFMKPVACYADPQKIVYYPNSIDQGALSGNDTPLPEDLLRLLDDKFCLVFAGNLGAAQSLDTICEAAALLRDLPDCKIVMVGTGSMIGRVLEIKEALNLDNLLLVGQFPMSAMSRIFSLAAGLLVTLKDEEIFSYTIPSKIQAYLAAGKPIIAAITGEGARVIEEAGAGLTCAAENSKGLADRIRELYTMTGHDRRVLGEAGKSYFNKHFDMAHQARSLVDIFDKRNANEQRKG